LSRLGCDASLPGLVGREQAHRVDQHVQPPRSIALGLEARDAGRLIVWGHSGMSRLTHLDDEGRAQMVDVGAKPDSERVAIAQGEIAMQPETLRLIVAQGLPKGDVLAAARIAGIMAAKRTPDLIPLCHP